VVDVVAMEMTGGFSLHRVFRHARGGGGTLRDHGWESIHAEFALADRRTQHSTRLCDHRLMVSTVPKWVSVTHILTYSLDAMNVQIGRIYD
jgi:hypothetical protein